MGSILCYINPHVHGALPGALLSQIGALLERRMRCFLPMGAGLGHSSSCGKVMLQTQIRPEIGDAPISSNMPPLLMFSVVVVSGE